MAIKRYVLAGAGARATGMFARPIAQEFGATSRLDGVFDTNSIRAQTLARDCNVRAFDDFDHMLRETRPDVVIVATIDRTHHDYIIRALEAGCDVISEKPMTIDAPQCRAILAAEARSGRRLTVTFNMRLMPIVMRMKELLREDRIGTVTSVNLEWMLDRSHGADYFRRWHRRLENSGGLLVHKSTHHFDMINWWLGDDKPSTVFATGDRRVYGPTRAERGVRCSTCSYAKTCEFYVDYASYPDLQSLYFSAEREDGYFRDGCVFSEEIDICDTAGVSVKYASGAILSYSLCAYSPYEGWRATLTGMRGRMEVQEFYGGPLVNSPAEAIAIFDLAGNRTGVHVLREGGDHGGSDALLRQRLFSAESIPDPLGVMADSRAGAMALLIGAAANQSIATGERVEISDLL